METNTTKNAQQQTLEMLDQSYAALTEFRRGIERLRERVGNEILKVGTEIIEALDMADEALIEFQKNNEIIHERIRNEGKPDGQ